MNSFILSFNRKKLRLGLELTHLIRIIGTVIVPITAEASRDAVSTGTGKILKITGHRFCIEQKAYTKLR